MANMILLNRKHFHSPSMMSFNEQHLSTTSTSLFGIFCWHLFVSCFKKNLFLVQCQKTAPVYFPRNLFFVYPSQWDLKSIRNWFSAWCCHYIVPPHGSPIDPDGGLKGSSLLSAAISLCFQPDTCMGGCLQTLFCFMVHCLCWPFRTGNEFLFVVPPLTRLWQDRHFPQF